MADGIDIKITGVNAVMALLNPDKAMRGVKSGIQKATAHVQGKIAQYPPDSRAHRPQPFVSDRQRRYFFAALRRGEIEVPYRRGMSPKSEALGRKWTRTFRQAGLTGIVGNNTSYARYVQGTEKQTAYHTQTGWKTTGQVADEEAGAVMAIVNEELADVFFRGF